jgi:hypothetical protein
VFVEGFHLLPSVLALSVGDGQVAGLAEKLKVFGVVMATPLAVLPFAGDDVVHFDGLCELFAVGALKPCAFLFDESFSVGPSVVVSYGLGAGLPAPAGLSA